MEAVLVSIFVSVSCFFVFLTIVPSNIVINPNDKTRKNFVLAFKTAVIEKIAPINERLPLNRYRGFLEKCFLASGDQYRLSANEFMAVQELSAFFAFFLLFLFKLLTGIPMWLVIFVSIFAAATPYFILKTYVDNRKNQMIKQLPFVIDMLTLSVEAGLDFLGALNKVIEKTKDGPLIEEISLMVNQIRMGKTRQEALAELGRRSDLEMVNNFVAALVQADKLGTPISRVLRIQNTSMRNNRTLRAEKLAGEAPVKMLFPLIFLIFPTIFAILFGPIILKFLTDGVY